MSDRRQTLWVLGAPDPEMERIEALLAGAGIPVVTPDTYHYPTPAAIYATAGGERVRGGQAYACDAVRVPETWDGAGDCTVYLVECAPEVLGVQHDDPYQGPVVRIDHHRPGDPGYGRPPEEFLSASSLGQVAEVLGAHVTDDLVLAAASDHCPAAAYRGRCPGVEPDDLMRWRAEQRAAFQQRPVEDLLADVEAASEAIRRAPRVWLAEEIVVADLRGRHVPEAPEASLRLGVPILADGLSDGDGRRKTVLMGDADGVAVRAFLGVWAEADGLTDTYGDPARGFAGGYA